jgi:hypothetical protein
MRVRMVNQDNTLRLPVFHIMIKDDAEHHWFTYEAIWSVKRIANEATTITQLETIFRDRSLTWYMKYKATTSTGQARSLTEIKKYMLREFQKSKLESQCIIEIKEIKHKEKQCGIMTSGSIFYWIG